MLILWLQKEREEERDQGLPSNQGRLCKFSQVATPDMWGFGRKPDQSQWSCQTQVHKQVAKSRRCAAFYFMQTRLKDLESENHFMVELQLLPFAVLLIFQYKHKLNWSIYFQKQSKDGFPATVVSPNRQNLVCWLNASENSISLLEMGLFEA